MTLGQRIQEGRKQAGLSQEALGEQLGISRQAISKWEGDSTIPEIDKLIAMSRLFGTTVGALLGVEPEAADAAQPVGELTERELAAVEEIVSRYVAESEGRRPRRPRWVVPVAALILLIVCGLGISRFAKLEASLSTLQGNLDRYQSYNRVDMDSLSGQIQSILNEGASLLSDYTVKATGLGPNKQVLFSLSATPKEYTEGMTATFVAEGEKSTVLSDPLSPTGTRFSLTDWPVDWKSLGKDITFSVTFQEGDLQKTQRLETYYAVDEMTGLVMSPSGPNVSYKSLGRTIEVGPMECNIAGGNFFGKERLRPTFLAERVYRNGELVAQYTFDFLPDEGSPTGENSGESEFLHSTYYLYLNFRETVTEGDEYLITMQMADNFGQEQELQMLRCTVGAPEGDTPFEMVPLNILSDTPLAPRNAVPAS